MRRWVLLAMIGSLAIGMAGCSGRVEEPRRVPEPAPLEQESTVETAVANAANEYSGRFRALNGSSVTGHVVIEVDDDRITMTVSLKGADAASVRSLAFHGFRDGRLAQAPPAPSEVAGPELARSTGPALLALAPFSAGQGSWRKTVKASDVYPLDIRALVLWDSADPSSSAARPLAYALLRAAELGDGGSGGPGYTGAGNSAGAAAGMGAAPGAESPADAGAAAGGAGASTGAGTGAGGTGGGTGAGGTGGGTGSTGAQNGGASAGAPGGAEGGSSPPNE